MGVSMVGGTFSLFATLLENEKHSHATNELTIEGFNQSNLSHVSLSSHRYSNI